MIEVLSWLGAMIVVFGYIGWGQYRTKVQIRKRKEHELYAKSIHSDKFNCIANGISVFDRNMLEGFDFPRKYKSVAVSSQPVGHGFEISSRVSATYFFDDESYVFRVFLVPYSISMVTFSVLKLLNEYSPQAHVEPYLVYDLK